MESERIIKQKNAHFIAYQGKIIRYSKRHGTDPCLTVGVATAGVEVYEDVLTARLDDNEIYSTNAGCAQLDVSLLEGNDRLQFGVSGSYQHPYDPCRDHGVFSNPLDMAQCKQTEVSPFGFSFPIAGKLGLDSSEDVILAVGGSKHVIVVYHYIAGFNISEFIRRMCDYEW